MDGNAQNMFHGNHQGDPYYRYDPAAAAATPRAMGPPGGYPPRHRAPHPLQQQPQYPSYQPTAENIYGLGATDQHSGHAMGMGDLSGWGTAPTVPGQAGTYPGGSLASYGHPQPGPSTQQRQSNTNAYRQHMPAYGQQDQQKLPYGPQQAMMSSLLQQPGPNVSAGGYASLSQQQQQQQQAPPSQQQSQQQARLPQHYPQAPGQHPLYPGASTQTAQPVVTGASQAYTHSPYGSPMQHQPSRGAPQHVGYGHTGLDQATAYGQHVANAASSTHHLTTQQQQAAQLGAHPGAHMGGAVPQQQHVVPPVLGSGPQQQQQPTSVAHGLQSQQQQQNQQQPPTHVSLMQSSSHQQQQLAGSTLPPPHAMGMPPSYSSHHQQQQQQQQAQQQTTPTYMTATNKHQSATQLNSSPQYRAPFPQLSPQMSPRPPTMSPHPQMSPRPVMSPAKPPQTTQTQQQQQQVNSPQQPPTHHSIQGMVGLASPRPPTAPVGPPTSKSSSNVVPPVNTLQALEQMVMPTQGVMSVPGGVPMEYPSPYRQTPQAHGTIGPRMPASPQHHQQWGPPHMSMQQSTQQQQPPPSQSNPIAMGLTAGQQLQQQHQQHQQQMSLYGQAQGMSHQQQPQQQPPTTQVPTPSQSSQQPPATNTVQHQQQQQLSDQLQHSINDIVGGGGNQQQTQMTTISPMQQPQTLPSMHHMSTHHQLSSANVTDSTNLLVRNTPTIESAGSVVAQTQPAQSSQHPSPHQHLQQQQSPLSQAQQQSPHHHMHQQQSSYNQSPLPQQQQQPQQQLIVDPFVNILSSEGQQHQSGSGQHQQPQQHQQQQQQQTQQQQQLQKQQTPPPQQQTQQTPPPQQQTQQTPSPQQQTQQTPPPQQHTQQTPPPQQQTQQTPPPQIQTQQTPPPQIQQQQQQQTQQHQQPQQQQQQTQQQQQPQILQQQQQQTQQQQQHQQQQQQQQTQQQQQQQEQQTQQQQQQQQQLQHEQQTQQLQHEQTQQKQQEQTMQQQSQKTLQQQQSTQQIQQMSAQQHQSTMSPAHLSSPILQIQQQQTQPNPQTPSTPSHQLSSILNDAANSNDSSTLAVAANDSNNSSSNSSTNSIVNNQPTSVHDSNSQSSINSNNQQPLLSGLDTTAMLNSNSNSATNVGGSGAGLLDSAGASLFDNNSMSSTSAAVAAASTAASAAAAMLDSNSQSSTFNERNASTGSEFEKVAITSETPTQTTITLETSRDQDVNLNKGTILDANVQEEAEGNTVDDVNLDNTQQQSINELVNEETKSAEELIVEEKSQTILTEAEASSNVQQTTTSMLTGTAQQQQTMSMPVVPQNHGITPNQITSGYDPQQAPPSQLMTPSSMPPIMSTYPGSIYPPYPMLHQQEIAALQQQLQEIFCMPPAHDHQEKILRLQERLNILQQHEINEQCVGGPQCMLYQTVPPMYGGNSLQNQMVESPQVSSTTGRGRGKGTSKPRKPRGKKGEKGLQQSSGDLMDISGNVVAGVTIPPTQLPVSEDCVTQGAGDTSVVGMLEYNEGMCDLSQDVHSANELDTSTDGTGKKKKPRKPRMPKDPNKPPRERTPKVKKVKDSNDPNSTELLNIGRKRSSGLKRKKQYADEDTDKAEGSEVEDNKPLICKSAIGDGEPETTSRGVDGDAPDYDDIPVSKIPTTRNANDDEKSPEAGDETVDSVPDSAGDATTTPSRRDRKRSGGRSRRSAAGDDGTNSTRRRATLSAKALKKRRNRGRIVPESDGEDDTLASTPPPSPPPDSELDSNKRRSSRNTQRKKYVDDVMLRFSDDDNSVIVASQVKKEKKPGATGSMVTVSSVGSDVEKVEIQEAADAEIGNLALDDKTTNPIDEAIINEASSSTNFEKDKPNTVEASASAKPNYVYINTGDEDSMVVQYVLAVRMGKRELIPERPPISEVHKSKSKFELENSEELTDNVCRKEEVTAELSQKEVVKDEEQEKDKCETDVNKEGFSDAQNMDLTEISEKNVLSSEPAPPTCKKESCEPENPTAGSDEKMEVIVEEEKAKVVQKACLLETKEEIEEREVTYEGDNNSKQELEERPIDKMDVNTSNDEDTAKVESNDTDTDVKNELGNTDSKVDNDNDDDDDDVKKSLPIKEKSDEINSPIEEEGCLKLVEQKEDGDDCNATEPEKLEPVYIDVEEYFVKYRNFSYLHCEWRTEEELLKGDRRVAAKVRRFQQKQAQQMNIFDNIEEEPFNPDFVEVDRVLDMSVHADESTGESTKHYLIKWKSLAYEDCTWELEEDVDDDKIEQYLRFNKIPPRNEWKSKKRPNPEQWKKLEKTLFYKSGNSLRPYQLEGLNWLKFSWYNSHNCILADEMGLGKTIQSLTFVHSVYEYGIRGPFLVIAPLSTIPNWQREFEGWTDMNIVVYHGSVTSKQMIQDYEFYYKTDSGKVLKEPVKFNVLITTFEMIVTDHMDLKSFNWRLCVIDEAHRLKNRNCKLLEGLRQLNLEHRVLLSGTPLQNNMGELFSLLNFLEPSQFSSAEEFMSEFGSLRTEEEVNKLQILLKPMMLRRLKDDVEKSLAPKEETIIEVELTNIQKKYYRGILEQNFSFLKKGTTSANIPNLMNTMMELRKCCIHPYLLNGAEEQIQYDYRSQHGEDPESYYKNLVQSAGKMVLIDKLLPKLKANGHRVLIFSQMVRCLDILEDYLVYRKYPFERIDGRIRGNLRQEAIDRYSKPGSDRFVFLLCTKAGGLGINLTAADTVIIYDSDWNPQNDLQAQARCHRIGQRKMVKIYRLLCRNTYEREMFDKASLKLGLDKAVLQSMNTQNSKDGTNKQLSKKEIEDLLKKGAYGAVMDDDNAGDKFCEEDIDSILKRRTQVITMESEKGSTFSKASFAASGNRSDITIDDPDFWTKWAKKADIDLDACERDETEDLVLSEPRRRTQIKRYGHEDVMEINSEDSSNENSDEDGGIGLRSRKRKEKRDRGREKKVNDEYVPRERDALAALGLEEIQYGNWAKSECFKVEKGLLSFGWGRWPEILELGQFKRGWRDMDIEDCARIILLYCLQVYKGDEKIKTFIWDLITPTEDGEIQKISRDHSGLHNLVPRGRNAKGRNGGKTQKEIGNNGVAGAVSASVSTNSSNNSNVQTAATTTTTTTTTTESTVEPKETQNNSNPTDIIHWSKQEKYDADAFLEGAYKKHLSRHANKVLLRVRMLYYIQHEVIGGLVQQIKDNTPISELPIRPPPTPDQVPSSWWNPICCDKSLLVGTYKHGCEMYRQMRADPTLCFVSHVGAGDDVAVANLPIHEDDANSKHEDGDEVDDDGITTKDSDSTKLTAGDTKESLDTERPSSSGKSKDKAKELKAKNNETKEHTNAIVVANVNTSDDVSEGNRISASVEDASAIVGGELTAESGNASAKQQSENELAAQNPDKSTVNEDAVAVTEAAAVVESIEAESAASAGIDDIEMKEVSTAHVADSNLAVDIVSSAVAQADTSTDQTNLETNKPAPTTEAIVSTQTAANTATAAEAIAADDGTYSENIRSNSCTNATTTIIITTTTTTPFTTTTTSTTTFDNNATTTSSTTTSTTTITATACGSSEQTQNENLNSNSNLGLDEDESVAGSYAPTIAPVEDATLWPSMQDLNTRLRRVITAYQRNYKKEELKLQQKAKLQALVSSTPPLSVPTTPTLQSMQMQMQNAATAAANVTVVTTGTHIQQVEPNNRSSLQSLIQGNNNNASSSSQQQLSNVASTSAAVASVTNAPIVGVSQIQQQSQQQQHTIQQQQQAPLQQQSAAAAVAVAAQVQPPMPTAADINLMLSILNTTDVSQLANLDINKLAMYLKMERQGKMELAAKEREAQRLQLIPKKWNRREEYEFLRVLTGYGVDMHMATTMGTTLSPDWTKFKQMAHLERKSDETISDYYKVFIAMCKRQAGVKLNDNERGLEAIIEDVSEEHAKLILDRLELLSKLREVNRHSKLEERLKLCTMNSDTPDWWEPGRHDRELITAILKHGLYRSETFIFNDPNFSFLESEKRFIRELEAQIQRTIKLEIHNTEKVESVKEAVEVSVAKAEVIDLDMELLSDDSIIKKKESLVKPIRGESDLEKLVEVDEAAEMSDNKSKDECKKTPNDPLKDESIHTKMGNLECKQIIDKFVPENANELEKVKLKEEPKKDTEKCSNANEDSNKKIEEYKRIETNISKEESSTEENKSEGASFNDGGKKKLDDSNVSHHDSEMNLDSKISVPAEKSIDEALKNDIKETQSDCHKEVQQETGESEDTTSKPIVEETIESKVEQILTNKTDDSTSGNKIDATVDQEILDLAAANAGLTDPDDDEVMKEKEKAVEEECKKQAAELKARFPDLEVIQPTAIKQKLDKPKLEMCMIRWFKDLALERRISHIVNCVETNKWPTDKHYSAFEGCKNSDLNIALHECIPHLNIIERRSTTPDVITITTDQGVSKHLQATPVQQVTSNVPTVTATTMTSTTTKNSTPSPLSTGISGLDANSINAAMAAAVAAAAAGGSNATLSSLLPGMSLTATASGSSSNMTTNNTITTSTITTNIQTTPTNTGKKRKRHIAIDVETERAKLHALLNSSQSMGPKDWENEIANMEVLSTVGGGSSRRSAATVTVSSNALSGLQPPPAHQHTSLSRQTSTQFNKPAVPPLKTPPSSMGAPMDLSSSSLPKMNMNEMLKSSSSSASGAIDLSEVQDFSMSSKKLNVHTALSSTFTSIGSKSKLDDTLNKLMKKNNCSIEEPIIGKEKKRRKLDEIVLGLSAAKEQKTFPDPSLPSSKKPQIPPSVSVTPANLQSSLSNQPQQNQKPFTITVTTVPGKSKNNSSALNVSSVSNSGLSALQSMAMGGPTSKDSLNALLAQTMATDPQTFLKQQQKMMQCLPPAQRKAYENMLAEMEQAMKMSAKYNSHDTKVNKWLSDMGNPLGDQLNLEYATANIAPSTVGSSSSSSRRSSRQQSSVSTQQSPSVSMTKPSTQTHAQQQHHQQQSTVGPQGLTGEEPVPVINKQTGKRLTGNKAPQLKRLMQWLTENPNYEVDPKWLEQMQNPMSAPSPKPMDTPSYPSTSSKSHGGRPSSNSSNASSSSHSQQQQSSSQSSASTSASSKKSSRQSAIDQAAVQFGSLAGLNPNLLASLPGLSAFDPKNPLTAFDPKNPLLSMPFAGMPGMGNIPGLGSLNNMNLFASLAGMGGLGNIAGMDAQSLAALMAAAGPTLSGMVGSGTSSTKNQSQSGSGSSNKKSKSDLSQMNVANNSGVTGTGSTGSSSKNSAASTSQLAAGFPFLFPNPSLLYPPMALGGLNPYSLGATGLGSAYDQLAQQYNLLNGATSSPNTSSTQSKSHQSQSSKSGNSRSSSVSAQANSAANLMNAMASMSGGQNITNTSTISTSNSSRGRQSSSRNASATPSAADMAQLSNLLMPGADPHLLESLSRMAGMDLAQASRLMSSLGMPPLTTSSTSSSSSSKRGSNAAVDTSNVAAQAEKLAAKEQQKWLESLARGALPTDLAALQAFSQGKLPNVSSTSSMANNTSGMTSTSSTSNKASKSSVAAAAAAAAAAHFPHLPGMSSDFSQALLAEMAAQMASGSLPLTGPGSLASLAGLTGGAASGTSSISTSTNSASKRQREQDAFKQQMDYYTKTLGLGSGISLIPTSTASSSSSNAAAVYAAALEAEQHKSKRVRNEMHAAKEDLTAALAAGLPLHLGSSMSSIEKSLRSGNTTGIPSTLGMSEADKVTLTPLNNNSTAAGIAANLPSQTTITIAPPISSGASTSSERSERSESRISLTITNAADAAKLPPPYEEADELIIQPILKKPTGSSSNHGGSIEDLEASVANLSGGSSISSAAGGGVDENRRSSNRLKRPRSGADHAMIATEQPPEKRRELRSTRHTRQSADAAATLNLSTSSETEEKTD